MDVSEHASDWTGIDLGDPETALRLRQVDADLELIEHLRELREELGLTQAEVARRMGRHQSVVSTLERLGSDPRWSSLRRYAGALGVFIEHRIEMPDPALRVLEQIGRRGANNIAEIDDVQLVREAARRALG